MFATPLISRLSLPAQRRVCLQSAPPAPSAVAEKVFSVLLTETELPGRKRERVSGGYAVRMQLGLIDAIINRRDKDTDLNKLLKSFSDVTSCQVVMMTVNVPVSCARRLCGLLLWT